MAGKITYSIADLAEEFGVTARALRFYEDQDLICPERKGQTRVYSSRDRARLAWILRAKRTGFSLAEIGELLDLYDLNDGRVTQQTVTLERCRERIAALDSQREDIDLSIRELQDFCGTLERLIDGTASQDDVRREIWHREAESPKLNS